MSFMAESGVRISKSQTIKDFLMFLSKRKIHLCKEVSFQKRFYDDFDYDEDILISVRGRRSLLEYEQQDLLKEFESEINE